MRRRAAWWTMILVLAAATVAAAAVGGWHLWVNPTAADSANTVAQPVNPADQADKRNAVLDVVKTNAPKLLSYTPENVESTLTEAASLLTGEFKKSFTQLTHDVIIPGAEQKRISAVATVPAAGVESLTDNKATVLTFINQTVTVGDESPNTTASTVRVGLVKIDGKWLIEAFDPV